MAELFLQFLTLLSAFMLLETLRVGQGGAASVRLSHKDGVDHLFTPAWVI